jgi:TonB family protein
VLLVPERFFDAEDEDIAAALTHECAHLARRDFAKNLVYEVVAAAVAYHPMCRLMRRRIAETRELVCDEMAAGAAEGRPEYAASLLRLATSMVTPAGRAIYARETHAIGVFDANILEERIMRLTMDAPKASRMQKAAMAAVATCALLVGAGTATALSFDVTPQEGAAQSRTQEKIYKVGGEVSAPKLNHSVDATYPKNERRKGKTGTTIVVCSLVVDSDGLPRDIKIKKSAGSDFDASAMDAVRQYKFDPAMRQGKPVAVAVTIEVNFRLY